MVVDRPEAGEVRWWDGGIVYQIYVRSFQDSNGDGVGDLPGIISRLDYLNDGTERSLGVDAIWLTPIYPSPLFDFGYDVSDYRDIDPIYGTLDDFDRLVDEASRRGIRIVMDLVANHTSHLHPWFVESRSSRDNPKRDWYIWRPPKPGHEYPNNWRSVFGGPAWTWDESSGEFYMHAFLQQQPDLNWHNAEVRAAMRDVMRFWLERGVASFRLDAISQIGKHPDLPDSPAEPEAANEGGSPRPVYDRAQPVMHPWLAELRAEADRYGAMLVGEIYSLRPEELAQFAGSGQLHSVFNFDLLLSPWDAKAFQEATDGLQLALPADAVTAPVVDNHDNSRSFTRYDCPGRGEARAKLLATMLLTLPGCPFMYYGQEIGMHDVEIAAGRLADPVGRGAHAEFRGRDPERTPMQWTAGTNSGFSAGDPWLPMPSDASLSNVEIQSADADSILTVYRQLAWLRRHYLALSRGSYRSLSVAPGCHTYLREKTEQRLLVALNFDDRSTVLDLSEAGAEGREIFSSSGGYTDTEGKVALERVELMGTQGRIFLVRS